MLCELCVVLILCRIGTISAELINDNNGNSFAELDDAGVSNNVDNSLDYQDDDNIAGISNVDYPTYRTIPQTSFSCRGRNRWGYFADVEAGCQVFHICQNQYSKISFLCPIGSVFNQRHLICDWWYNFDCEPEIQLLEDEARPKSYTPQPLIQENPAVVGASSDISSVTVVSPALMRAGRRERDERRGNTQGQQNSQQQRQQTAPEASVSSASGNIDSSTKQPPRAQRRNSKRLNINKISVNTTTSSNNITDTSGNEYIAGT